MNCVFMHNFCCMNTISCFHDMHIGLVFMGVAWPMPIDYLISVLIDCQVGVELSSRRCNIVGYPWCIVCSGVLCVTTCIPTLYRVFISCSISACKQVLMTKLILLIIALIWGYLFSGTETGWDDFIKYSTNSWDGTQKAVSYTDVLK